MPYISLSVCYLNSTSVELKLQTRQGPEMRISFATRVIRRYDVSTFATLANLEGENKWQKSTLN